MMKMCIYSERVIKIGEGEIRIGEDALPFVNDAGMFVADGMGGSAGVRVVSFHPDCFCEDLLVQRLCSGLNVQDTVSDRGKVLIKYIRESFSSLTTREVHNLYQSADDYSDRLKKSGYVGSHSLGLAMVSCLLQMEYRNSETFYTDKEWKTSIEQLTNPQGKDFLFNKYREIIELLEAKCAKTSLTKIEYFGTTLAAAFFRDHGNEVEVFFINAGDSRSYVWDDSGFRQAVDDQGRNGGMTGYFTLSNDSRVTLSCEHRIYRKPCVLFCMTDGVYGGFSGNGGFSSTPLYMEGILMNTFAAASSMEEVKQTLQSTFDSIGGYDDSNSMVVSAFGYNSYWELKEAARARMKTLTEEYGLQQLPDNFLTTDYQERADFLRKEFTKRLQPVLEDTFHLPSVHTYCLQMIDTAPENGYWRSQIAVQKLELQKLQEQKQVILNLLETAAGENYSDFSPQSPMESSLLVSRCQKIRETLNECKQSYCYISDQLTQRFERMDQYSKTLTERGQQFRRMDQERFLHSTLETAYLGEDRLERWRTYSDTVRELLRDLEAELQEIDSGYKNLAALEDQLRTANVRLARKSLNSRRDRNSVGAEEIVRQWLLPHQAERTVGATTIPAVQFAIRQTLRQYWDVESRLNALNEKVRQIEEEAALQYWLENAPDYLEQFENYEQYFLQSPELNQRIKDILNQMRELKKCEELQKRQAAVFDSYLKEHLRDVSEDKRLDVEKNGWL